MSILPNPTTAPALKIEDWDFDHGRHEISVKTTVGELCSLTLTAHWEQFCEWATEEYDLAGYSWRNRTFTVLVERSGTRWDYNDFDYDEETVDAVEWLNERGFGQDKQARFFREMFEQAVTELQ